MSTQGPRSTTSWRSLPEDRRYQCTRSTNGTLCGRVFKRSWNLKRHVQVKHQQERAGAGSTFIVKCGPATGPSLNLPLSGNPTADGVPPPAVLVRDRMPPGLLRLPPLVPDKRTLPVSMELQLPPLVLDRQMPPPCPPGLSTLLSIPQSPPAGGAANMGTEQWLGRARFRDVMPAYDAPSSRKYPGQQKGLQWLSRGGKDSMDAFVTRMMASWGVRTTHSGTCIVWPQDWQALEPETVAGLLTFENTPLIDSDRSMYAHDDHITTTARAIAWFAHWPRTGVQLDNFLEVGPYQRNDGSHRCHNPLCINPSHLVLEPTWYNIGRQACQKRASFLRGQGCEVPPECHLHDPPCLMQHASLTMFEACAIQIFVLRDSYGLPQSAPGRPPWHRYPTFENQLPPKFAPRDAAVRLRPCDQTTLPPGGGGPRRPAIVCQLCSRIKSFGRVAALWSHVRKKHADRGIGDRLQEIRRSASLWGLYLETTRSNPRDPTVIKLAEIARDDFSWDVVEGWPM
ncbi:hypothetical protein F4680DRAFT_453889 [Xylaria scruposa]|nr:hypothetical protein F4680DRAFT_453889 [Xylaria scruposa]